MNKPSFKEFLTENGFPFLNVYNNECETIFGHTDKDMIETKKKKNKKKTEDDDAKTLSKLSSYLQYAKVIND